ncbi:MAG TPA: T9SS type A sorting domain-containing protein [Chitinophagaceae bacterium]|nr:T9SS type A sorting domain-containing protein [Chitinophagaceae bacterium]
MKNIYLTLLVLLAAMGLQAQTRTITTTIRIDTPEHGKYHVLLPNQKIFTAYTITNLGPDSIRIGDTIFLHDSRSAKGKTFFRTYTVGVPVGSSIVLNHIVDGPTWPVLFDTVYAPSYPYPTTDLVQTMFDANDKNIETEKTRKVYYHPFKRPESKDSARYAWYVEIVNIVPQGKIIPGYNDIKFSANGMGNTLDTVHIWVLGYPLSVVDLFASSKTALSVFPNPANNQVSFHFDFNALQNPATVRVMDAMGRIVKQQELDRNNYGTQKVDVDVSMLAPGSYFLRLDTDKEAMISKFLINR